jgi:transposase-like protein
MSDEIEPLPHHKNPIYYTGALGLISSLISIKLFNTNPASNILTISFFLAILSISATIIMWQTRCPKCNRSFVKIEDKNRKEKINEVIEAKTHYDQIKYLYSDGNVKSVENGKAHIINHRINTYRHHYHCKKCKHEWSKERTVDLDKNVFVPKTSVVKTSVQNPLRLNGFEDEKQLNNSTKNSIRSNIKEIDKVLPLSKYDAEKIIKQRGYICQYPGCEERESLEVHHIVQRANGGDNKPSNLIVLCPTHHHKADAGSINATRLKMIVSESLKNA